VASTTFNSAFSVTSTTGDTVGILVDLDVNTLSYFINGKHAGTAFGAGDIPSGKTWYPAVSLYELSTVEIQHFTRSQCQ